ncbi:MAG TPA: HEPN domain-containing protein [Armatimonadota bacterium]|nr:HEPN domain-containing protein [Armatimonadota bacterium]
MSAQNEWVEKAEADFKGASGLHRRADKLPDLVCYHCQQSVEKYLKAYLAAHGEPPPMSHDLRQLLRLCARFSVPLAALMPDASLLNPYGILIRYPGFSATQSDARDAIRACRRIRKHLRIALGL